MGNPHQALDLSASLPDYLLDVYRLKRCTEECTWMKRLCYLLYSLDQPCLQILESGSQKI